MHLTWVTSVLLVFSAVLLLTDGKIRHRKLKKHAEAAKPVKDADWDFLLFVQRWPGSACVDGHVTSSSSDSAKCSFPPAISAQDWVMHGIWPTKTNTTGPVNCDKNATWSVKPVDPILDQLNMFWPNFETATPFDSFWEHEWLKHGTCAENLPALSGELNFFTVPLNLRKQYSLYEVLLAAEIAPSATKLWSHDQFTGAVQAKYGQRAEVWCAYSSLTKEHYVAEIRLCLSKTLELIECPETEMLVQRMGYSDTTKCPQKADLNYPPIKTTGYRKRLHSRKGKKHVNL